jgi:hypothetical protein
MSSNAVTPLGRIPQSSPVEIGGPHLELGEGSGGGEIFCGPVEAGPSKELDRAFVDAVAST